MDPQRKITGNLCIILARLTKESHLQVINSIFVVVVVDPKGLDVGG